MVPIENDPSIRFPRFFEHTPVKLGAQGELFELDGVLLQALMIAANHRFPHETQDQPCLRRREAHQYRVIRRGDIIFVRIDQDLEFCGLDYVISLDSGVTYAISTNGRILRRVFDGEPVEWEPLSPAHPTPMEPQDGGSVIGDSLPLVAPSPVPDARSPGELERSTETPK
jgi:hypothetical protein